jgi:hypothetical protein
MFNLVRVWENDFVLIVSISFLLLKSWFFFFKNTFLKLYFTWVYCIKNNCIAVKYCDTYRKIRVSFHPLVTGPKNRPGKPPECKAQNRNESKKSCSPKWQVRHENNSPQADYFCNWRSGDQLVVTDFKYQTGSCTRPDIERFHDNRSLVHAFTYSELPFSCESPEVRSIPIHPNGQSALIQSFLMLWEI